MEFKDGLIILINLAILGIIIAAAVYIFQIGNKKRSLKCSTVDNFSAQCGGTEAGGAVKGYLGDDEVCRDQPDGCSTDSYQCADSCNSCAVDADNACTVGDPCDWMSLYDCSTAEGEEYDILQAVTQTELNQLASDFTDNWETLTYSVGTSTNGFYELACAPGTCHMQFYMPNIEVTALSNQVIMVEEFFFNNFMVAKDQTGYFSDGQLTLTLKNLEIEGDFTFKTSSPSDACAVAIAADCLFTAGTDPLCWACATGSSTNCDFTVKQGDNTITLYLSDLSGIVTEEGMFLNDTYTIHFADESSSSCSGGANKNLDGTSKCPPIIKVDDPDINCSGDVSLINGLIELTDIQDWGWAYWGETLLTKAGEELGKMIYGTESSPGGLVKDFLGSLPSPLTTGDDWKDSLIFKSLTTDGCTEIEGPDNIVEDGNKTCPSGQYITCEGIGGLCTPATGTGCDCEAGAIKSKDYFCKDCSYPNRYSCGVGVADKFGNMPECENGEDSSGWPTGCASCPSGETTAASGGTYCY